MESYSFSFGLLSLVCVLMGSVLLYQAGDEWLENRDLQKCGLVANARIVERSNAFVKGGDKARWLMVNFVPESGERQNIVVWVSDDYYRAHEAASTSRVRIRYMPDNLEVAVLEGDYRSRYKLVIAPLLLLLAPVFYKLMLWRWRLEEAWANGHY